MNNFGIVIPTKDRFISLCHTLDQLAHVNRQPEVVVVVDSSEDALLSEDLFEGLGRPYSFKLAWIKCLKPGTAVQRNIGIKYIQLEYPNVVWVMLLDDDLIFKKSCFDRIHLEAMCRDTLWFALPTEHRDANNRMTKLGKAVCGKLGLYPTPGKISRSGFHSPIDPKKPEKIEWAPTALMLFYVGEHSKFNFSQFFSEAFTGYGYLEDLEMSIRVKSSNIKFGILEVDVGHPTVIRDSFSFGEIEVRNRLRVVRALPSASISRFGIMMSLRILKSLYETAVGLCGCGRFAGSLWSFVSLLFAPNNRIDRLEEKK